MLLCSTVQSWKTCLGNHKDDVHLPCNEAQVSFQFPHPPNPNPPEKKRSEDYGGGGAGEADPDATLLTCVLSFRVECCCSLALQERELKKIIILWRCVSFVCALFFSDVRPIYEKKKIKKKENCGGNGIPPRVNKENSSCRFFHV